MSIMFNKIFYHRFLQISVFLWLKFSNIRRNEVCSLVMPQKLCSVIDIAVSNKNAAEILQRYQCADFIFSCDIAVCP